MMAGRGQQWKGHEPKLVPLILYRNYSSLN